MEGGGGHGRAGWRRWCGGGTLEDVTSSRVCGGFLALGKLEGGGIAGGGYVGVGWMGGWVGGRLMGMGRVDSETND